MRTYVRFASTQTTKRTSIKLCAIYHRPPLSAVRWFNDVIKRHKLKTIFSKLWFLMQESNLLTSANFTFLGWGLRKPATANGVGWYGHVLRKDDDSVVRVALDLEVSGKSKRG